MDQMLAMGKGILEQQAFSKLLGAELLAFGEGCAELALNLKPEHLNQHGVAHGGVLAYLADNALTYAGGSVLGTACVTLEMKINYLKPARGERLIARSRVAGSGKQQAVCQCEVFAVDAAGEETLCSVAQGTIWKVG